LDEFIERDEIALIPILQIDDSPPQRVTKGTLFKGDVRHVLDSL
jgi:hypothetical protein